MGQYYRIVNLDKRQYLDPHVGGEGAKLVEVSSNRGISSALIILLADGNGRGGGDLHCKDPIVGSWAGDRIVVAGDYADPGKWIEVKYHDGWRTGVEEGTCLWEYVEGNFEDITVRVFLAMAKDDWFTKLLVGRLQHAACFSSEYVDGVPYKEWLAVAIREELGEGEDAPKLHYDDTVYGVLPEDE